MPIPVTKYRCGFKCGIRSMHSKQSMEKHELGCWKNPESKTCATCVNQEYWKDGDDERFGRMWHCRGCKLPEMNEFINEIHEDLEVGGARHIKPLFHCPNHNQKEVQRGTQSYCSDVKDKIYLRKQQLNNDSIPF